MIKHIKLLIVTVLLVVTGCVYTPIKLPIQTVKNKSELDPALVAAIKAEAIRDLCKSVNPIPRTPLKMYVAIGTAKESADASGLLYLKGVTKSRKDLNTQCASYY